MTTSRLARIVTDLADAAYMMLSAGDLIGYDRTMTRAKRLADHYNHRIPGAK